MYSTNINELEIIDLLDRILEQIEIIDGEPCISVYVANECQYKFLPIDGDMMEILDEVKEILEGQEG